MFDNDWDTILQDEMKKDYIQELHTKLDAEYKTERIFPPKDEIFNALKLTSYTNTRVVIIGQDPYHGEGQAEGLSFSVKKGVRIPPSLRNIYKELHADLGIPIPSHGSLKHWACEGVLLLNNVLTVREGKPNSHKGIGWERFTDAVIEKVNERNQPAVFMLWGNHAQKKGDFIDRSRHLVIESAHPSPLSARHGFIGSSPFSKANEFLESQGMEPIDWMIPEG